MDVWRLIESSGVGSHWLGTGDLSEIWVVRLGRDFFICAGRSLLRWRSYARASCPVALAAVGGCRSPLAFLVRRSSPHSICSSLTIDILSLEIAAAAVAIHPCMCADGVPWLGSSLCGTFGSPRRDDGGREARCCFRRETLGGERRGDGIRLVRREEGAAGPDLQPRWCRDLLASCYGRGGVKYI
jgi:hypothetical protein